MKTMTQAAYQEVGRRHPLFADPAKNGDSPVALSPAQDGIGSKLGALPLPQCTYCGRYHWGRCH